MDALDQTAPTGIAMVGGMDSMFKGNILPTSEWTNRLVIAGCGVWLCFVISSAMRSVSRRFQEYLERMTRQSEITIRRLDELDFTLKEIREELKEGRTASGLLNDIRTEIRGGTGAIGPLRAILDELEGNSNAGGPLMDIRAELQGHSTAIGPLTAIQSELTGCSTATGPLREISEQLRGGASATGPLIDIKDELESIHEAIQLSSRSGLT